MRSEIGSGRELADRPYCSIRLYIVLRCSWSRSDGVGIGPIDNVAA